MKTINQWPKQIPILEPSDFEHQSWENDEATDGAWCGTTRCMVGWVGSVFHNNAEIVDDGTCLSKPCRAFLLKLAELTGMPADEDVSDWILAHHVSNIFEGESLISQAGMPVMDGYHARGFKKMSADDAAKLWRKTLRSFGYTQLVDVK